jgi:putative addiction module killer protein
MNSSFFQLKDFDARAKMRISKRLNTAKTGNLGDTRFVGGGVYEMRIDYGPGYRVYFSNDGNTIVILLCGGDKRTQQKDIDLAQEYWIAYKQQKGGYHGDGQL